MTGVSAYTARQRLPRFLDDIKAIGYKYSTIGALSVSISDMTVPKEKPQILEDAQKQVEYITKQYRRGFMTEEERYKAVSTDMVRSR